MANTYQVNYALYGAFVGDYAAGTGTIDVTATLQSYLNVNNNGVVPINNQTFGNDPSVGNGKNFVAQVVVNGDTTNFACSENQTIDFS